MFKYLAKHIKECIALLALIVIGILLLINPELYAVTLIRVIGALLVVVGILRIIEYFRTEARTAAEGDDFAIGLIAIIVGCCCMFWQQWFVNTFPMLASFYGLFQLLLGFHKVQKTIDCLRLKYKLWYLVAATAVIYLIFGLVIVSDPGMTMMNVWTFTGVTMIIEGVAEAVTLYMMRKEQAA